MAVFSWLFSRAKGHNQVRLVPGDGDFNIVGESNYQDALELIVGGRTEESADHSCDAMLVPEPSNPYDHNAVRVTIDGHTIGYLARQHAIEYHRAIGARTTTCEAVVVGGWDRGDGDRGHFGAKLDIAWPPRIVR